MTLAIMGSPPRVRSRQVDFRYPVRSDGITSACAEQTNCPARKLAPSRDHLRVCGADFSGKYVSPMAEGSPPRVQSRLTHRTAVIQHQRITSACAEQT